MLHQIIRRDGFSLIALLIVISIILIPTAGCLSFRDGSGGRELNAIKSIRTIHQAEVQYKSLTAPS